MNINRLNDTADGEKTIEIRCNHVSYRAIIRILRGLPGVIVTKPRHNPLTDDAAAEIDFKTHKFLLSTPFSDYHISTNGKCPDEIWDEFVASLRGIKVRWWEKLI